MASLTIFTPTFNRIELLERLYKSLLNQSVKEFVWLIVDDGSTDKTNEKVRSWIENTTEFEIKYLQKENGGLYTAYNAAIETISTELSMCIDSDDYLPNNAVENILSFWSENGNDTVAGIVALDCYQNGKIVGDPLPKQSTVNLIDLLVNRYNINNGDRTNIVRTEIYKRYAPLIGFEDEKNFNPHYLHIQMSLTFDFLVMNIPVRIVEYQISGMSNNIYQQYLNSPKSFLKTRKLYLSIPNTPLKFNLKNAIHYNSSAYLCNCLVSSFFNSPKRLLTFVCIIPGILLTLFIKLRVKKEARIK